ncbi:rRNA-processing protein UTP23 like [Pseudolycoriella hygida]|uniref:rRNA-processing protein UTP23 homolog n=1 Tax=Pseudolycoriella hygida TaxID=35572 RepID=A0A9Q0S5V8_9DIPT|nr:rRNA-processing protein UTP23 like [Pseudolycoriella hygida]
MVVSSSARVAPHILNTKITFGYPRCGSREPFQVIIDATFCQVALEFQIKISEQIPNYLQSESRLITTQCIIEEAESLGSRIQGAVQIVKQFVVHRCGHDKKPIPGADCIRSMCKQNKYIVATQDRELQEKLRLKPGQPIIYLHKRCPVLEQPSEASRKFSDKKIDETFGFGEDAVNKLKTMKRRAGIEDTDVLNVKKKKFKRKQPNPLSCKKKKKRVGDHGKDKSIEGVSDKPIEKKQRSRIRKRVPKHVKEHLLALNKSS